jgi:hypothetical protein
MLVAAAVIHKIAQLLPQMVALAVVVKAVLHITIQFLHLELLILAVVAVVIKLDKHLVLAVLVS